MNENPTDPTTGDDPIIMDRVVSHLQQLEQNLQPLQSGMVSLVDRAAAHGSASRGGTLVLALLAVVALSTTAWYVTRTEAQSVASGSQNVEAGAGAEDAPSVAPLNPEAAAGSIELSVNPGLDLDWKNHESILGFFHISAVSGGDMYVVSTAPGVRWDDFNQGFEGQNSLPQALYSSSDGRNWSSQVLDDAIRIADLTAHDGVVYAISTSPAADRANRGAGPTVVEVISSSDDGQNWDSIELASSAEPPTKDIRFERSSQTQIAAAGSGVAVTIATNYWADFLSVAPKEFRNPNKYYAEPREDGIHVFDHSVQNEIGECMERQWQGFMEEAGGRLEDPDLDSEARAALDEEVADWEQQAFEECEQPGGEDAPKEAAFVSWEELGFDGLSSTQHVEFFLAADGANYELVDIPELEGRHVGELRPLGSGFLMTTWGEFGGGSILFSHNGLEWTEADIPGVDWVMAAGDVGGRMVLITQGGRGQGEAWVSDDRGVTWSSHEISAAVAADNRAERWLSQAAVGPLGAVAVVESFTEGENNFGPSYTVMYSPDGVNWEVAAESEAARQDQCCPNLAGVLVTEDEVMIGIASSNSKKVPSHAFVGTVK